MNEYEEYHVANDLFSRLLQNRKDKKGARLSPPEVEVVTMILDGTLQTWDEPREDCE